MKALIFTLALLVATPLYALSPLEDNVQGDMLPVIVDENVKPYYDKLTPEQRNCEGQPAKNIRLIPEGGMVTMDHSPTRLNIEYDKNDNILRAYCG